ncbi:MAG: RNA polymerase sigma factor [Saprospiraceae bacterium]|nr:RNA polymerase sigma factor [Saprospiraceae bacterium]
MSEHQDSILGFIRGSELERAEAVKLLAANTKLRNDIFQHVINNSGSSDDALMIFHDSIIAFVKKVFSDHTFVLSGTKDAYIFGIARMLWLDRLRKDKNNPLTYAGEINQINDPPVYTNNILESEEKKEILHKIMLNLHSNCRNVLMYWAGGYSMEEIARLCGYKSEGMARKKKCECYKELIIWLEAHPEYLKELKN